MSIENTLERIATALEAIAGRDQFGQIPGGAEVGSALQKTIDITVQQAVIPTVIETPKKSKAKKVEAPVPQVIDEVPGIPTEAPSAAPLQMVNAPSGPNEWVDRVSNGAELRALAQGFIQAAEASDPGGKTGAVNKLVTFIQSVAKIFNPKEPKLIKIPDDKCAEAASMIKNWCDRNGIAV